MTGWSRLVADPGQALAALARPGAELDLRAAGALDDAWRALGFCELVPGELAPGELVPGELVPGELVRPLDVVLADLAATRALGARLGAALRPGDLLVLTGPLGAGKTSLVQGLGEALGVRGSVTSPTFVLARTHRGPLPLTHVDAYRLRAAGTQALDLQDALEDALEDGVVVVEWGEGLVESLSPDRLHVALARPSGALDQGTSGGRTARVQATGSRWGVVQPHSESG